MITAKGAAMALARTQTLARLPLRESAGFRLAMSVLMALSILIASFASVTAVHAGCMGGDAFVGQSVEAKAAAPTLQSFDQVVDADATSGVPTNCTGDCFAHAPSLPIADTVIEPSVAPETVWHRLSASFDVENPSARLDRPPRQ